MPERTWLDILLRREPKADLHDEDEQMLVEHKRALEDVDRGLASSRARIIEAINETGDAIVRERRRKVLERLHR